MTITLRHLEILRAIAGNRSLTLAAKQLGLSQPSLSQQLSKLEGDLGQRLVDRSAKGLHLTDAGCFLLGKAEPILSMVEEAEIGLGQFEHGLRGRLTIGALTSLARSLVTPASIELKRRFPEIQLNVVELSPDAVVRQLQSRRVQIALISSALVTDQTLHFTKVELASDPYVLAVPKGMDGGREPLRRSVIMVDFGQSYQDLVQGWYRRIIPDHQEVARCRTHELALSMVEAGLGMAIVPMLSTQVNGRLVFDVDLFELPLEPRKVWAVLPSQYRYTQPHARVIEMLKKVGKQRTAETPILASVTTLGHQQGQGTTPLLDA
ncbi:MAG: LysR family transcriptional regulator [Alphaproteobacteria bacterium]|nr:LysR family transcriptional regulator [Alphaproteobacteria bacterium]